MTSTVFYLAMLVMSQSDTVVAVKWEPRESKELRDKIDAAILEYAELLHDGTFTKPGGRTLQALGLISALPRLPEANRLKAHALATVLVSAERDSFWPQTARTTKQISADLHPSTSYHLPLILLLLEHTQAGALSLGDPRTANRDREMRFGIVPPPAIRKDVVRLLALLVATHSKPPLVFKEDARPGKLWGYTSFGSDTDSCVSPTGMASIGLSAAIFGLNVLDYETNDFQVHFSDTVTLSRADLLNRITDVCAHLIFSLARGPQPTDSSGLTLEPASLDTEAFRSISTVATDGTPLFQIEARKPFPAGVPPAFYHYQGNAHRGAYHSACVSYTLPTAARVLAHILERESNAGAQYQFVQQMDKSWKLTVGGQTWTVKKIPDKDRRLSPLNFSGPEVIDVDVATYAALNGCLAAATITDGQRRRLRTAGQMTAGQWIVGGDNDEATRLELGSIHAFALYKAAVAVGDGYSIGRWPVWHDLADTYATPGFAKVLNKSVGAANPERKAAALCFAVMTMTRTYRPVFPKSTSP